MQKRYIIRSLNLFSLCLIFFILVACAGSAPAADGGEAAPAEEDAEESSDEAADSGSGYNGFLSNVLEENGQFQILLEALEQSDLLARLDEHEYYTFFAPTDDAFQKLPPETLEQLLSGDSEILNDILFYHVVDKQLWTGDLMDLLTDATFQKSSPETLDQFLSGNLTFDELSAETEVDKAFLPGETGRENDANGKDALDSWHTPTVQLKTFFQDKFLTIALVEGQFKANNAQVVEPDLAIWDGVIHGINTVLLPVAPPSPNSLTEKITPFLLPLLSEELERVNEFESWYPYEPGKALFIGDAELVPLANKARVGVEEVSNILQRNKSITGLQNWINTARTVRLSDSQGTIYLAPIWSNDKLTPENLEEMATDAGIIIGLMVVDATNESPLPSDSYVVHIRFFGDDGWFVELVNPEGKIYDGIPARFTTDQVEMKDMPSTALYYGTIWCEHWLNSFHFCYPCWYSSEKSCAIEHD